MYINNRRRNKDLNENSGTKKGKTVVVSNDFFSATFCILSSKDYLSIRALSLEKEPSNSIEAKRFVSKLIQMDCFNLVLLDKFQEYFEGGVPTFSTKKGGHFVLAFSPKINPKKSTKSTANALNAGLSAITMLLNAFSMTSALFFLQGLSSAQFLWIPFLFFILSFIALFSFLFWASTARSKWVSFALPFLVVVISGLILFFFYWLEFVDKGWKINPLTAPYFFFLVAHVLLPFALVPFHVLRKKQQQHQRDE